MLDGQKRRGRAIPRGRDVTGRERVNAIRFRGRGSLPLYCPLHQRRGGTSSGKKAAEAGGGCAPERRRLAGGTGRADARFRRGPEEGLRRAARILRRDGGGLQGPRPQVVRRGGAGT